MSTLSFERGTAFMERQLELSQRMERLIALAGRLRGANGRSMLKDDAIAARLATLRGEVAAMRAMTYMAISRGLRQDMPGPEGTFLALYYAELTQRMMRFTMELLGSRGLERSEDWGDWTGMYLSSFSRTIGGGTAEIRRNIIGERVLGLPRDR